MTKKFIIIIAAIMAICFTIACNPQNAGSSGKSETPDTTKQVISDMSCEEKKREFNRLLHLLQEDKITDSEYEYLFELLDGDCIGDDQFLVLLGIIAEKGRGDRRRDDEKLSEP